MRIGLFLNGQMRMRSAYPLKPKPGLNGPPSVQWVGEILKGESRSFLLDMTEGGECFVAINFRVMPVDVRRFPDAAFHKHSAVELDIDRGGATAASVSDTTLDLQR